MTEGCEMLPKSSAFFKFIYLFLITLAAVCLFSGCDGSSSSSRGGGDDMPPELDDYRRGTPAPLTTTFDSTMGSSGAQGADRQRYAL